MRNHSERYSGNVNESGLYGLFKDATYRDKKSISGGALVPTDAHKCRVSYDGKSVYSDAKFRCGDIIEICPVRQIMKDSLYTREVRDMALEVEPDTVFVIPLGYCQHYDIISKQHPEANCDYEWDGDKKCILIRALCTIPKHQRLILNLQK